MSELEIVDVSSRATEWCFHFKNSSPESCDVDLRLIEPFGTNRVRARLTGSFSLLVEPNGDFYLADFDAELSSFDVLLRDSSGQTYPYDIGRLSLALDRSPSDSRAPSRRLGPNTGYVDLETGFTELTWSVYADSPQLRAVEWDPIRLTVNENGQLDLHTLKWNCAGYGTVTSGELEKTGMWIMNFMDPTPQLMLELPPTIRPRDRHPIKIKYRDTVPLDAPPPDRPEVFELSGWVARSGGSGEMSLNPSSVEIAAGADEEFILTTTGLALGSRVQIWARGAGLSCVGSTVVCE